MSKGNSAGISKDDGLDQILRKIKTGRIDSERKSKIDAVLNNDLTSEERADLVEKIQLDPRAKRRIAVREKKDSGDYVLSVIESGPRSKKPIAGIIVAVIVVVAAFAVYTNYVQEHPMESLELHCNEDVAYAGEPFLIRADISPSNTTDKSLEWKSNLKDVTITERDDKIMVLIGPKVKTGDVLTITAFSNAYGIKESISIPVENQIKIGLDYDSTQVTIGEGIDIGLRAEAGSLVLQPEWSVDKSWVELSPVDSGVTMLIGYEATKGDSFVLTAKIPGTELSVSQEFTVSEGLSLKLTASSDVVSAGSSFTVSAVVKPMLPPDAKLVWDVDYGGLTYTVQDCKLSGVLSSDADHNVKVTVTASVDGYKAQANVTLTTSNPSRLPVDITSIQDMLKMKGSTKVFNLQNDIDMSSVYWTPFEFNGILNGNGHTITGLKCEVSAKVEDCYYGGLFTVNKGTINDLIVKDAEIKVAPNNKGAYTMLYSGVVCGINTGTISDVTIKSSEILAHSTNIKTSWLVKNSSFPKIGSGSAKSGDWYDYASLKFTGTYCTEWVSNAVMNVFCGGVAGTNSGSITRTSVEVSIDAEVINFHYTADTARVYAGGIVGSNTGKVDDVATSGEVHAELVLHDSGKGTGDGLGYLDAYVPVAVGYVGGLAGYSNGECNGFGGAHLSHATEVYAPTYVALQGSHYDTNERADDKCITWHKE